MPVKGALGKSDMANTMVIASMSENTIRIKTGGADRRQRLDLGEAFSGAFQGYTGVLPSW